MRKLPFFVAILFLLPGLVRAQQIQFKMEAKKMDFPLINPAPKVEGPVLDAEALSKLRSGVIIVKSDDPNVCKQLKFNNETGTFGAPLQTSCDRSSTAREAPDQTGQHSGGQLGSIRDSFRGR